MGLVKDLVKKFDKVASSAEASETNVIIKEANTLTDKPLSEFVANSIKIPGELTSKEKSNVERGIMNDKISIVIPFPKRLSPDGRAIMSVSRAEYEMSIQQHNESNIFPIGEAGIQRDVMIRDDASADGKNKAYKRIAIDTEFIAQLVDEAQHESFSKRGSEFGDIVEPDDTQRELGE